MILSGGVCQLELKAFTLFLQLGCVNFLCLFLQTITLVELPTCLSLLKERHIQLFLCLLDLYGQSLVQERRALAFWCSCCLFSRSKGDHCRGRVMFSFWFKGFLREETCIWVVLRQSRFNTCCKAQMFLVMLLNSKVSYTYWENRGVKWEKSIGMGSLFKSGDSCKLLELSGPQWLTGK